MNIVLHDGTERRVQIGQSLMGARIKHFTVFAEDALHPNLAEWLAEHVLTRMDLPK